VLQDHLGSSDTLLNESGAMLAKLSFGAFGVVGRQLVFRRGPDWLGIANTTRQGYTGHEALDNLGLVHMNGRVYDPALGRFMSPDPLIGDPTDSQAVNPYAYVGNRPLNAIDPSGYQSLPDLPVPGGVPVLQFAGYAQLVFGIGDLLSSWLPHGGCHRRPRPRCRASRRKAAPASAAPAHSRRSAVDGSCMPARQQPVTARCRPRLGCDLRRRPYAMERLGYFFIDVGINAVDVLILSPMRDVEAAYDAARNGDYVMVGVYVVSSVCDLAKPCNGLEQSTKAIRKLANAAPKVKYIGKLDDLKGIPGDKTLLDQLPDRGSVKAITGRIRRCCAGPYATDTRFATRPLPRQTRNLIPPCAGRPGK